MFKQERADLSPPPVQVGPLDNSKLYTRRHHEGGASKNSFSVSDSKSGPQNVSSLTSDYEELDGNGNFTINPEALEETDTSKSTLTQPDGPSSKTG